MKDVYVCEVCGGYIKEDDDYYLINISGTGAYTGITVCSHYVCDKCIEKAHEVRGWEDTEGYYEEY